MAFPGCHCSFKRFLLHTNIFTVRIELPQPFSLPHNKFICSHILVAVNDIDFPLIRFHRISFPTVTAFSTYIFGTNRIALLQGKIEKKISKVNNEFFENVVVSFMLLKQLFRVYINKIFFLVIRNKFVLIEKGGCMGYIH